MIKKIFFITVLFLGIQILGSSQTINNTLIKADKLFIKHEFVEAAKVYEHYLKTFPKDYYASRQAAICYKKTNNQSLAIDHWPNVIESSKVTDADRLDYAKCLLANYRLQDAKMMINFLRSSPDKAIAAWGSAYSNTDQFYQDSANTRVTEVSGINTKATEFCPIMTNDKLLFVSEKNKTSRIFVATGNDNNCTLHASAKKDDTHFSEGELFANKIQSKGLSGQVSLSADGTTLYFCRSVSSKALNKISDVTFYKFQLYSCDPNSEKTEVTNSFIYNSADHDCMHPSISKDGLKLYFASDMKGTLGGKDIFVCEWMNGAWGTPKNLGPTVNTPGDEVFPTISEDGILYFASDARPGLGGLDIFYAEPNKEGNGFNSAKNAGVPINTQFDDYGIFVLKGGKAGYFSSNRKNNLQDDDVYYFVKQQ
jgi:Tol biopolymer transport system component